MTAEYSVGGNVIRPNVDCTDRATKSQRQKHENEKTGIKYTTVLTSSLTQFLFIGHIFIEILISPSEIQIHIKINQGT